MTPHSPSIKDSITQRHCKRAFLDKPVPKHLLESVLQSAGHAASSKNSQPWQVAILQGQTKQALIDTMCNKFDKDEFETADYIYMTDPMPAVFKQRAKDCGYALYALKNISKEDHQARKAHFRENYTFFGAPVGCIFHIHEGAERGNFLDMGLFIQNVMLGLTAEGLGSCPQFSITSYSNTIRTQLKLTADRWIVCGMAVGYPDPDAIVNTFIPKRCDVTDYTQWFD